MIKKSRSRSRSVGKQRSDKTPLAREKAQKKENLISRHKKDSKIQRKSLKSRGGKNNYRSKRNRPRDLEDEHLFESSLVYSRRTKKTCTNPNSFTAIFQQEQILSVSYDFYTHAPSIDLTFLTQGHSFKQNSWEIPERKSSFSDHRISIEERDQFDEDDEEEKRPYPDLQKGLGDQKDILEDFEFFDQPETCYNIEYFEQNLKANLMMNYNEDFSSQSSKSVRSNEGTLSLNSHSNKFSVESDESLKGFSPSFDRDCFESEFFGMGRNRRDKRNKGK